VQQRRRDHQVYRFCRNALLALCGLVGLGWLNNAAAQQLSVESFTTANGLAQDKINKIVSDSRGWLWICTDDGLSQFDGYGFINYGTDHGLPHRRVDDLLETREGKYLVATGAGVCLFNPRGKPISHPILAGNHSEISARNPMFITLPFSGTQSKFRVIKLLQDHGGSVWCATAEGLFRLDMLNGSFELESVDLPNSPNTKIWISALCEDRYGAIWIGTRQNGLYRRWANGHTDNYKRVGDHPLQSIAVIYEDRRGSIWVSAEFELLQLKAAADYSQPSVIRYFTNEKDISSKVDDIAEAADGTLWLATDLGLNRLSFTAEGASPQIKVYTAANGLKQNVLEAIMIDSVGNLWVGTRGLGVMKLNPDRLLIFGEADGVRTVNSILSNRTGEPYFLAFGLEGLGLLRKGDKSKRPKQYDWRLGRYDGQKLNWRRPDALDVVGYFGWGWNQKALQDHTGEWWIATGKGLYRFPIADHIEELQKVKPKFVYTTQDGLISNDIYRVFEDSRGDLWVLVFEVKRGLYRWDRKTDKLHDMSGAEGAPPFQENPPTSLIEDHSGNLWIGFRNGGLAKYRDGKFTFYSKDSGVPAEWINELFVDRKGRLWIASNEGGLGCLEHPEAEKPEFKIFTTKHGLSSDLVNCITEDNNGYIYFHAGSKVNRLDTSNGFVKHLNFICNGVGGEVHSMYRGRDGSIWIGSNSGLARYLPQTELPIGPSSIVIKGLRIAGESQALSALGETEIPPLRLPSDRNQIQIDFIALNSSAGEGVRYQYKLEGSVGDWSPLSEQRSVNFANLKAGNYRFLVRALNADGVMSLNSAAFPFSILRPFWQQWWFLSTIALALTTIVYGGYRYQKNNLRRIESVRRRIATDLHDDVGSNLSQISILSEVMQRNLNGQPGELGESLSKIASTARESVDAMSDLVWTINPKRDSLRDLTQRMRVFAGEMLGTREIELRFDGDDREIKLAPETRRNIYLIFKECVNNVTRHSRCTKVDINLIFAGDCLHLVVCDNGRGFDQGRQIQGNGLSNLRSRAEEIGAVLVIGSEPGLGTVVTLRLPLKRGLGWKKLLPEQVGKN
jgi:ligand-binding sensor domain-containing protein